MNTQFNYIVNPTVIVPGVFANGQWTATLPSAIYARDLTRVSLQGPVSSQAKVYLGAVSPENLFDFTQRGAANTADYSGGPAHIQRSATVIVVWTPLGGVFTGLETVSATFSVRQAD